MMLPLMVLGLVILNISSCQGQLDPPNLVYVDADKGEDNEMCGRHRDQSCKHLAEAVKRIENGGTIHTIGDQVLNESITLIKNIIMMTTEADKGRVIGNGKVLVAFIVKKMFLDLKIHNLSFCNISVVEPLDSSIKTLHLTINNIKVNGRAERPILSGRYDNVFAFNSSFTDTAMVFHIREINSVFTIRNCLFTKTKGISVARTRRRSSINILDCKFHVNELNEGQMMSLLDFEGDGHVTLISTRFSGNKGTSQNGGLLLFKGTKIKISHCLFQDGPGLYMTSAKDTVIQHSSFTKCSTLTSGGALSVINLLGSLIIKKCSFQSNQAGKTGGAIYLNIRKGMKYQEEWKVSGLKYIKIIVSIYNSTFHNNEAYSAGQSIHSNLPLRLQNITINALEVRNVAHLQLEGEVVVLGDLRLTTSENPKSIHSSVLRRGILVTTRDLRLEGKISVTCPKYFNIKGYTSFSGPYGYDRKAKKDPAYTLFMSTCTSCPREQYTLRGGELTIITVKNSNYSVVLKEGFWRQHASPEECLPCPSGANCDGNIIPLDNFWGYRIGSNEIKAIQCPLGFCCSGKTTPCKDFNTCSEGRTGKLCGTCTNGYSQSFVSDGCIRKDGVDCDINIFLTFFIATSFLYTIIFTFLPTITEVLKEIFSTWKDKRSEADNICELNETNFEQEANEIQMRTREEIEGDEQLPVSACVMIICFFFQIASLVHIKIPRTGNRENEAPDNGFQSFLFDFFNFRLAVYRKLCPMDNLTLPMKEFINVGLKVCSIFNLLFFLIGWVCVSVLRKYAGSSEEAKSDIETVELTDKSLSRHQYKATQQEKKSHRTLSFVSILKIGFIKLIKLNITSISTFAFRMTHCEPIGETMHLYLYGDLECYTDWQYSIFFVVLPLILLFPAAFGFSLNLLKERKISTSTFLMASVLPYFALWLYIKEKIFELQKKIPSTQETKCVETILEMEEELFKSDDSWIRWPVVQLYRNFIVVVLSIFILNPIYRTIAFVLVFLTFIVHDFKRMPHKHPFLNILQWLSSSCLCVFSIINIPASLSIMTNAMSIPGMASLVHVLQYVEMLIFVVMLLSIVGWKLWEKYVTKKDSQKKMI